MPGGRRIITCPEDGSLRLWGDLNSGAQIGNGWQDEEDKETTFTIENAVSKLQHRYERKQRWEGEVVGCQNGANEQGTLIGCRQYAAVQMVDEWSADPTTGLQGCEMSRAEKPS